MVGAAAGAVAGLVAITPASGLRVTPAGPLHRSHCRRPPATARRCFVAACGSTTRSMCSRSTVSGARSARSATGVFAVAAIGGVSGAIEGNVRQVALQLVAVLTTYVFVGVATFGIIKVVDALMGIRVPQSDEELGSTWPCTANRRTACRPGKASGHGGGPGAGSGGGSAQGPLQVAFGTRPTIRSPVPLDGASAGHLRPLRDGQLAHAVAGDHVGVNRDRDHSETGLDIAAGLLARRTVHAGDDAVPVGRPGGSIRPRRRAASPPRAFASHDFRATQGRSKGRPGRCRWRRRLRWRRWRRRWRGLLRFRPSR